MIEARDLSRSYGGFTAVDGVSFSVDEGEIVGILGPNGAGKTTIIRMITGFLPPTGGRVTVAGKDLFREPRRARREIGYLPEHVALYPEMRVREYLAYRGRLVGMPRAGVKAAVAEAVESALLTEVADQVIGTLSRGYRQRVGLATAILHHPRVLVLDEPTVGLDPAQIIAIRELIRDLGGRRTLLLSTHILPEVELLCDRVLIVDRGHIVAQGTPAELARASRGRRRLRVAVKGAAEGAAATLAALPGVARVEETTAAGDAGDRFLLEIEDAAAVGEPVVSDTAVSDTVPDPREAVFRAAVEAGWVLVELAEVATSLEDVFIRLTARDTAAEAAAGGDTGGDAAGIAAESEGVDAAADAGGEPS